MGAESTKRRLAELGLVLLSALLFALSFPSALVPAGLPPLAFVALAPALAAIGRTSRAWIAPWGMVFGGLSYLALNHWLAAFHPLALLIVVGISMAYFAILFPVLRLAGRLFPEYGHLLQALCWLGYEYLRTTGFLGYPFGLLGYSQAAFVPLIQVAELGGVWLVSAIVVFPSTYLGAALARGRGGIRAFALRHRVEAFAYLGLLACALVFGAAARVDYAGARTWKPALVQDDSDPGEEGLAAYRKAWSKLKRLSDEAIARGAEIVIWPETAFVPAIEWHLRFRPDRDTYDLVRELADYVAARPVPFVIGNDEGVRAEGQAERVDYNAALLVRGTRTLGVYRKRHLVPFAEHFPYGGLLPGFRRALADAGMRFWARGDEATVFEAGGVRFSTPICFEDAFGDDLRDFANGGAQVLACLTDDSWSRSVAAERQHLQLAVLRAVETRRSLVRAANGGITCAVDPNGRIIAEAPPFREALLLPEVPVYDGRTTLYARLGDWAGLGSLLLAVAGLALGSARALRPRSRGRAENQYN